MPQHEVELPRYWLARYPVTVGQWRAYVEASGHEPTDRDSLQGAANQPVSWVTWHEALAYSEWLHGQLQAEAQERSGENEIVAGAGSGEAAGDAAERGGVGKGGARDGWADVSVGG